MSALRWVDEFVPQFYDTAHERMSAGIAQPIDPSKWAPVFNAYHVPYRIGISSFGRIARRRVDASGRASVHYFRDVSPMAFAGRKQLTRSIKTTSTGEVVVHYDILTRIEDKPELRPGDVVEITFPTEASVRAADEAARQFGGYCAGILAFRWPSRSETMTLAPDDVERIRSGESLSAATNLEVRHAECIERQCQDLYLDLGGHVLSADRTIGIRAAGPMDMFLPGGPLHPSTVHASEILVRLPAYSGLGKVYLGRTISHGQVDFEVVRP